LKASRLAFLPPSFTEFPEIYDSEPPGSSRACAAIVVPMHWLPHNFPPVACQTTLRFIDVVWSNNFYTPLKLAVIILDETERGINMKCVAIMKKNSPKLSVTRKHVRCLEKTTGSLQELFIKLLQEMLRGLEDSYGDVCIFRCRFL
jgi:hypothetical protein